MTRRKRQVRRRRGNSGGVDMLEFMIRHARILRAAPGTSRTDLRAVLEDSLQRWHDELREDEEGWARGRFGGAIAGWCRYYGVCLPQWAAELHRRDGLAEAAQVREWEERSARLADISG